MHLVCKVSHSFAQISPSLCSLLCFKEKCQKRLFSIQFVESHKSDVIEILQTQLGLMM